jgi:hypothetical protein
MLEAVSSTPEVSQEGVRGGRPGERFGNPGSPSLSQAVPQPHSQRALSGKNLPIAMDKPIQRQTAAPAAAPAAPAGPSPAPLSGSYGAAQPHQAAASPPGEFGNSAPFQSLSRDATPDGSPHSSPEHNVDLAAQPPISAARAKIKSQAQALAPEQGEIRGLTFNPLTPDAETRPLIAQERNGRIISGEADSASEIQVTLPDRLEAHRNNETAKPSPQPHLRPSHSSPSGRGAVSEGAHPLGKGERRFIPDASVASLLQYNKRASPSAWQRRVLRYLLEVYLML